MHAKQRLLDPKNKSLWVPDLTCPFVHAKHRDLQQNMKSMRVPAIICVFCIQNRDFWTRITNLYGSQTWPVVLCMQNSVISTWKTSLLWVPALMCGFWMQNSDLWTRITSLYGSQTLPIILCMYNGVISIRINNLYGSQPSSVVYACKTATFWPDLQSLRVPDLTCRFVQGNQHA